MWVVWCERSSQVSGPEYDELIKQRNASDCLVSFQRFRIWKLERAVKVHAKESILQSTIFKNLPRKHTLASCFSQSYMFIQFTIIHSKKQKKLIIHYENN